MEYFTELFKMLFQQYPYQKHFVSIQCQNDRQIVDSLSTEITQLLLYTLWITFENQAHYNQAKTTVMMPGWNLQRYSISHGNFLISSTAESDMGKYGAFW